VWLAAAAAINGITTFQHFNGVLCTKIGDAIVTPNGPAAAPPGVANPLLGSVVNFVDDALAG
jgi:hypothetical protein